MSEVTITQRASQDTFDVEFALKGRDYRVQMWVPERDAFWINEVVRLGPGPKVELDEEEAEYGMAEDRAFNLAGDAIEKILETEWLENEREDAERSARRLERVERARAEAEARARAEAEARARAEGDRALAREKAKRRKAPTPPQ